MIWPTEWEWFGQAGHFCGAADCRWHLHTHVGDFCISSVGEYHPGKSPEIQQIGSGRFYETYVFVLERGETNGVPIDTFTYTEREAARDGHMEMCRKYASTVSEVET